MITCTGREGERQKLLRGDDPAGDLDLSWRALIICHSYKTFQAF